jgi:hypothetical protein
MRATCSSHFILLYLISLIFKQCTNYVATSSHFPQHVVRHSTVSQLMEECVLGYFNDAFQNALSYAALDVKTNEND